MHALIENGSVAQYPYGIADLNKAHPNVSFPKNPDDSLLAEFGMQRVFFATQPEVTHTQTLEEKTPIFSNEDQRWTQVWSVRDMTEDEMSSRNTDQALQVRAERNNKLAASDWTQLADTPVDKAAWAAYRQALRDITAQAEFPWTINWPTQPE